MERSSRYCKLTYEEIAERYLSGQSSAEISAAAGVTSRSIRRILNKLNVEMRPHGSWKRKHTLNEDYFKHWSDKMAYLLGFFVADGMVSEQMQTIGFAQKERSILEEIRTELNSTHKIYLNEKTKVYNLIVHSKKMKEDLIHIHGMTARKSKTIEFPLVPDQYMSHFIRGYFDGDGHINYKKYQICFVGGSESFMNTLSQVLSHIGIKNYSRSNGKHYRVHISGRRSIQEFAKFIYQDKNLYLDRKYQEFKKEKLPIELLKDRNRGSK
ncbi:hypothetical protein BTR22_06115 [Alkalihalophilus pseudofirmus]|uniref:LAGLIDADG family homing endonuclease n=1 Tax=Alkalihalophilus pseudofirmus TaxID=79885 RepID=UPI000951E301|nr:hypothetical protein BTR22_06115 [Alkalihalophilus pseudofirmus]